MLGSRKAQDMYCSLHET